jgi:hypothetical protein
MSRTSSSKIFVYKGVPYMRIIPTKRLFNSTTVHEVVTRGDFFAVNLKNSIFTVLPKGADDEDSLDNCN